MKDTNNSCFIELKQTGVFNCKKEQCELKHVNSILRSEVGYWKKQHERAREREEELKKN